jgi:hypothetical protein
MIQFVCGKRFKERIRNFNQPAQRTGTALGLLLNDWNKPGHVHVSARDNDLLAGVRAFDQQRQCSFGAMNSDLHVLNASYS